MESVETVTKRARVEESKVLIRELEALKAGAIPSRIEQLSKWQSSLVWNNQSADADTTGKGIAQIKGYLSNEQKAVASNQPMTEAERRKALTDARRK